MNLHPPFPPSTTLPTLPILNRGVEPQTVNWKNCANTDIAVKAKRVVMGFFIMLAGAMGVKRWLGHVGTILKSSQTWGPKMGFGREVSDRKMAIFISWRVF